MQTEGEGWPDDFSLDTVAFLDDALAPQEAMWVDVEHRELVVTRPGNKEPILRAERLRQEVDQFDRVEGCIGGDESTRTLKRFALTGPDSEVVRGYGFPFVKTVDYLPIAGFEPASLIQVAQIEIGLGDLESPVGTLAVGLEYVLQTGNPLVAYHNGGATGYEVYDEEGYEVGWDQD